MYSTEANDELRQWIVNTIGDFRGYADGEALCVPPWVAPLFEEALAGETVTVVTKGQGRGRVSTRPPH